MAAPLTQAGRMDFVGGPPVHRVAGVRAGVIAFDPCVQLPREFFQSRRLIQPLGQILGLFSGLFAQYVGNVRPKRSSKVPKNRSMFFDWP